MIQRLKMGNNPLPVYVKDKDRFKHLFCIGKTGTGKSQFILNCWQNDSIIKVAKILIDPSGFLSRDAYSVMKEKARYCSLRTPISLNPMVAPYRPNQIADIISEAVNQMVKLTTPNEKLSVKMLEILNDAIVYCLAHGQTTLENVKANIMARPGNAETRDGIIARLNLLLQDEDFKQIICGPDSFEINRLVERQESFILDCSGMGTSKKIFVGTLLTNLVKSYFLYSRPKKYLPFVLYVDEAHNFISEDFSLILKEARKYQVSAFLATTDFSVIARSLIHTILSNAGTLIALRAGFIEASMIAREFTTIATSDIQNLEKYHAAIKTSDVETIVKLPRPLFVRQIPIPARRKAKKLTFGIKWFDLPPYSFQLDYDPDGRVAGDDFRQQSKTLPTSNEVG